MDDQNNNDRKNFLTYIYITKILKKITFTIKKKFS